MKNKEHYLSNENKSFCILPWIHSNIHTTGEVRLCCIDQKMRGLGSIDKDTTWADVWNNDLYKQVRLDMLAGKPVENCTMCYKDEAVHGSSYRTTSNQGFGEVYFDSVVTKTEEDGSTPMDIRLLDIRWSNICNLKCRMCDPTFSSLIATELKRTTGQSGLQFSGLSGDTTYVAVTDKRPEFLKEIIPYMKNIEGIYFAGGEPMVTPEHYEMLELLIANKLTHVALSYNTNLTRLSFKKWNVLDLWAHFDPNKISLRPSLDSWGARAEYLRTGTVWSEVEDNITTLMRSNRKVINHLRPTVTITAWNILTYTDFMDYMIDRFNFTPEEFGTDTNILTQPFQMSLRTLPPALKQLALDKIDDFCERRKEYIHCTGPTQNIINSLQQIEYDTRIDIAKPFIDNYDKIRSTNFVDAFPELKEWYNGQ